MYRHKNIPIIAILSTFLFSACSSQDTSTADRPKTKYEGNVSILTGTSEPYDFLSDSKNNSSGDSIPVNAILWRAALDIASFVPLDDVDTFGGSIVTEWHQPENRPDQRLKLTIFVIGRELRSDAIKVNAYVQNRLGTEWLDSGRDETLGRKLEDLILNRSRELRAGNFAETTD